jgi:hypothetical protein
MYAVVVNVTLSDPEAALKELQEEVVPRAKQAPGFVTGYWTRKDNTGLSMVVFESEEQARAMSEHMPTMVPEHVSLQGVEIREVAAHA